MLAEHADQTPRVHVLVRAGTLRATLTQTLSAAHYQMEFHSNVHELWTAAVDDGSAVALLDWTLAEGLLNEERRHDLAQLTRRIQLVVLVPDAWLRHLSAEDVGAAALVAKAAGSEVLLQVLREVMPPMQDSQDGIRWAMNSPSDAPTVSAREASPVLQSL
jgi:FixJ family two-component response regulator